jgi:hypothetical protein
VFEPFADLGAERLDSLAHGRYLQRRAAHIDVRLGNDHWVAGLDAQQNLVAARLLPRLQLAADIGVIVAIRLQCFGGFLFGVVEQPLCLARG